MNGLKNVQERRRDKRYPDKVKIKVFYKEKPMKRGRNPEGKHHPYCSHVYKKGEIRSSWNCCCGLLKSYDKWRKKNENK